MKSRSRLKLTNCEIVPIIVEEKQQSSATLGIFSLTGDKRRHNSIGTDNLDVT